MTLRLVMMGTGEFALPTFLALYESPYEIVGLFTQPDREGRGHHHHPHPMKEAARRHDTPVFQPENVNDSDALEQLRSLNADLCVVAAYGQILSAELLNTPRRGALNLHASLLPKYRGAAPIQYAILNGETQTGITIFQIDPKLDSGPILGAEKTAIHPGETSGELERRLSELAAPLCLRVIDQIENGTTIRVSQDPAGVTRAPRLKKEDGAIDWTNSPEQIGWHVRAMQPWPKAYTFLDQPGIKPQRLIVLEVAPSEISADVEPGTVVFVDRQCLVVQAGKHSLEIVRLQPEGKRAMSAAEFLQGHSIEIGQRMTSPPASA